MRRAVPAMFPVLLDALWQSPDPDEALNQFERFVAAAGPRTAYLELLADRPDLLTNLVKLCARGELLTQLLLTQPELLNRLADPATFAAPRRRTDFRRALAPALASGLTQLERMDGLRRLKQAEELGIIWRLLLGVTDADRFSREMTALADFECRFVAVSRMRGQQLKEPAQLDGWLRDGSAAYAEGLCDWG